MRNFGGVPLIVALGLLLSACSSEPNLIAGDATDATQPSVQSRSAVADDSAPFEVIPNAGAFLETTDEFSANDYPLLRYMEPDSYSGHPGSARFVLIDDGEPARDGSDQFPLFVIGINAYIAESAPIDYYFFYNNHNQNEFGEIGYGRCRGVSGRFAQQSSTTYRFEEGRYPQVEDHGFDVTTQGCGDMPPLTPANIFDGTVELEYGDTDITVISEDGQRWAFQQIPIRSARQRAIDALPTTTAAATTTTTTTEVERTDSDETEVAFETGVVMEVDCPGSALCASAFDLNGIRYNLSCGAISNDAVGEEVLGTGVYSGQEVSVHAIGDYPVVDVVAISLTGGLCGDVNPEEFTSPWSFAFNQTDADVLDAVCEHGVMSPAQSRANGCES